MKNQFIAAYKQITVVQAQWFHFMKTLEWGGRHLPRNFSQDQPIIINIFCGGGDNNKNRKIGGGLIIKKHKII